MPRPWIMKQAWCDLLFAHWAVPPDALRRHIPAGLDLDLCDGRAWLGVVPFVMRGIRLRGLPPLPGHHTFPELNLRTYVRRGDRSGVWFFSLDAPPPLAVWTARRLFHLPYHRATIEAREADGWISYLCTRRQPDAPAASWSGRYRSIGDPGPAPSGTLEHFLTERDCLFARDPRGRLWRGDVRHPPWPLEPAEVQIQQVNMTSGLGLSLGTTPDHALFSRRVDTRLWPLVAC